MSEKETKETQTVETQPAETKSVETQPAETESVETKSVVTESVEKESDKTESAEMKSEDKEAVETESAEEEPVETEPAETEYVEEEIADKESEKVDIEKTETEKTETEKAGKLYSLWGIVAISILLIVSCAFAVIISYKPKEIIDADVAINDTTKGPDVVEEESVDSDIIPMEKRENYLVCLDAGHGGKDAGATTRYYYEKDHNLEIILMVRDYLLQYDNIDVMLTREDDTFVHRLDRIVMTNEARADVFVSVHRNSNRSSRPQGFEIYIGYIDEERDRPLAEHILNKAIQVPGTVNGGIRTGSADDYDIDYLINRHSLMPGCLIELGYMSNKNDNYLYNTYKEDYARYIGEGIVEFLGIDLIDDKNEENDDTESDEE